jgi:hypothetical protein
VPAVAVAAIGTGVVGGSDVWEASDALAAPLGFLLVAVPLALVLDDLGFSRRPRRSRVARATCALGCGCSRRR